jgi:hypothetical protein
MESDYVTIKVSTKAHEKLRNLKHVFFVDTYPEAVDKLIEEHLQKQEVTR